MLGTHEFSIGDCSKSNSVPSVNNLEKFPRTNSIPVGNQSWCSGILSTNILSISVRLECDSVWTVVWHLKSLPMGSNVSVGNKGVCTCSFSANVSVVYSCFDHNVSVGLQFLDEESFPNIWMISISDQWVASCSFSTNKLPISDRSKGTPVSVVDYLESLPLAHCVSACN